MKLNKNFDRSLWVFHLNTGSCNGCDIEIVALLTPRYDVERFGIKLVGSPKHADVLLVTGPVDKHIPVDVYVPGCPIRPEAIINGVLKAWLKLERIRNESNKAKVIETAKEASS